MLEQCQHNNQTLRICLSAIPGIAEVSPGDDLGVLLTDAMVAANLSPGDGDIIICSQKIVSKAEGRRVALADVTPSLRALALARDTDKDPALVELILSESEQVLRARPGLIIVRHRLGLVMANAGIDQSNLGGSSEPAALLLPRDPDASAQHLRAQLQQRFGVKLAVLIIDSAGRAWRSGVIGLAIGCSGLPALLDLRGAPDRDGRTLNVTEVALADQIASAAALLTGEAAEGRPAVLLSGLNWPASDPNSEHGAAALIRPVQQDLFL